MLYVDLVYSCHVTYFAASRVCPITHVTMTFVLLVEATLPKHSFPVTYVIFYWRSQYFCLHLELYLEVQLAREMLVYY